MQPTEGRKFQAMYIMLDALRYPYPESNRKYELIQSYAAPYHIEMVGVDVHAPDDYPELDLYFNYLKVYYACNIDSRTGIRLFICFFWIFLFQIFIR